jgi:hypothetical protein
VVGLLAWPVVSFALFLILSGLGLVPQDDRGGYAAALFCALVGMYAGGGINGYIRERFPKFDKWNT